MPRKPAPSSSDEIAREIARLKEQHEKVEAAENMRRGRAMAELLKGNHGEAIRQILDPIIKGNDVRPLFGLDPDEKTPRRRILAANQPAPST